MNLSDSLRPLAVKGDERGSLIAIESGIDVPFPIARAYYLFGTRPGVERGFHAHKRLQQFAVAVSGSCMMTFDDGVQRRDILLDDPSQGVLIPPLIWHEMREFSETCVLLVLADDHYDERDYIRDYSRFLDQVRSGAK